MGKMVAAMKLIGFDAVFDTAFMADITTIEEATEIIDRIQNGGKLPVFTSCCPAWVKYAEMYEQDMLANLSSCKSPQEMGAAVIRKIVPSKAGKDNKHVVVVSVMPCTAKKFEAQRPELAPNGLPDVDYVLTTREAARLLRTCGINMERLEPDNADTPFGERSSAGKIFGAGGGVMEAAIRSAHFLLTGKELSEPKLTALRGTKDRKEMQLDIDGLKVGVAVVSGLGNARTLMNEIAAGRSDIHFIEVMACPGGCVGGGGQPIGLDRESVKERMKTLYNIDRDDALRVSHKNANVQRLYREFLGEPLGHRSHELLHTHYGKRDVLR